MKVLGTVFVLFFCTSCLAFEVPRIRSEPNRRDDRSVPSASPDAYELSYKVSQESPRTFENLSSDEQKSLNHELRIKRRDSNEVVDCSSPNGYLSNEVIFEKCETASKIYANHGNYRDFDFSKLNFQSFLNHKTVFAYGFLIEGTNLTTIEAKKLIELGSMTLMNNPLLKEVKFATVEELTTLKVDNNPMLIDLDLRKLKDLYSNMIVTANAAIESIKFPELNNIEKLVVERNAKLMELNFCKLRDLEVVSISDNRQLETIILGSLTIIDRVISISITRNPTLASVLMGKFKNSEGARNVRIYGNKNLLRSGIHFPDLSHCIDCYIQEDNECIFDELITDLSELDDCKNIYGNLTFSSSVTGNTKTKIQAIQQNLYIANTTFGGDGLNFLENAMVKGEFEMYVTENSDLEFFKIHEVAIISDNLIVERNTGLKELLIRKIKNFTSPAVNISDNEKLESIVLGGESTMYFSVESISVDRNPKLTKIVIGKFKDTINARNIRIYGNRNLLRAGIHFPHIFDCINCYIQEDNECVFDEPITDLSELDGCKNIYGSLIIDSEVTGNTSTKINTIQENLIIRNTALTIEDLHFLVNTTVNGKFEFTGPCSSKSLYLKLKLTIESDKKSFNPKYCLVNCTGEELVTYKQPHCEIVTGNIIMEYCSYTAEDVENFKSIKKVIGGIGMNYVGPKNFSLAPLMFDNLEVIETPKGGSSIEFWNLKYTNEFIAPKLVRVINPDKHFIELNGNNFSNADGKEFETCVRMEARLAGREFDPEDLQIGGYVTRIIRVNESELHYDDGASIYTFLPVLLILHWNI